MNGVLNVANSPLMWLTTGIAIAVVILQAIIFYRKSWKTGQRLGLSAESMKEATKAAAITSFGPSIAVATGLLALIYIIGAPMAWMRLGYVGALPYETLAVQLAVEGAGLEIGKDVFGGDEFVTICFVMTAGAFGYTIVATFLADKVENVTNKLVRNDTILLGIIASAALMSSIGGTAAQYLLTWSPNFASLLGAIAGMLVFGTIARKKNILWLKEFSLFFAIICGLIAAAIAR